MTKPISGKVPHAEGRPSAQIDSLKTAEARRAWSRLSGVTHYQSGVMQIAWHYFCRAAPSHSIAGAQDLYLISSTGAIWANLSTFNEVIRWGRCCSWFAAFTMCSTPRVSCMGFGPGNYLPKGLTSSWSAAPCWFLSFWTYGASGLGVKGHLLTSKRLSLVQSRPTSM